MAFTFQGQLRVSLRRQTFRVTECQQSTTENTEEALELIHKYCHQTNHELADTIGFSCKICQEILTENLNMRRIAVKFVPLLFANDQKQLHINI
jgi:hypothetical protein